VATASLSEKVLRIEEGLRQRRIPHAFGGAIALAYYGTPRATIDIDVNVFVSVKRAGDVLGLLEVLGADPPSPGERAQLDRDEQVRVHWDRTPVDLFFSYDTLHESCLERRRRMPFGDHDAIHVLAAEDLLVFKVLFDRDKDWRDIAELVYALGDELDAAYAKDWLERILGSEESRYGRLCELLEHQA
jgi:hypothetical protein